MAFSFGSPEINDSEGEESDAEATTTKWPEFLASLRDSERYGDLTIQCENRSWQVNSAIVGSQSPVIEKAISPHNGYKESREKVFKIDTADAGTTDKFIQFLYTGDYACDDYLKARQAKKMKGTNQEIAQHLDFETLAKQCCEREIRLLLRHVDVLVLADYLQVTDLRRKAGQKICTFLRDSQLPEGFVAIVNALNDNNIYHKPLIDGVAAIAANHISDLLDAGSFRKIKNFDDFYVATLQACDNRMMKQEERLERAKRRLRELGL